MGGADIVSNGVRFVTLLFLQVFLFRQVNFGLWGADYLEILVSPLFIALLPVRTPRALVVVLAFLLGAGTDLFYESLGVHMAAASFTGYARSFALRAVEPQDGYKAKANPDGRDLGLSWWMRYLALILVAYLFWYCCMEAFSPVFWKAITLKLLVSIPISWIVCIVLITLFRPRI